MDKARTIAFYGLMVYNLWMSSINHLQCLNVMDLQPMVLVDLQLKHIDVMD